MPTGYFDDAFYKRITDEANARNTATQKLTGLQPLNYAPATGGTPAVTSPGYSAAQATQANLGNLPALTNLADQVNAFNRTGFYAGIPNYSALNAQSSANIGSALRGELPQDVVSNLARSAAERGVALGSPGSPNANANFLRNLGLTSLDQQRYGESAFTNAVSRGTRAPYLSPVSGFVTPEQQQEAEMTANIYEASPIPAIAQQTNMQAANRGLQTGFQGARSFGNFGGSVPNTSAGVVNSILSRYAQAQQPNPINSMAYGVPWGGGNQAPAAPLYPTTSQLLSQLYEGGQDYGNVPDTTNPYAGDLDVNGLPFYLDTAPYMELPFYDPEVFYSP